VEVVELWDPNSDSISQVGLVADKTGQVQFTSWSKSDLQDIEQGKTYRLKAVITDEYEGRYQIKLNSQTEIKEIKEEKLREDIQGMMIQLKEGSGLIMRDEDGRVVDRNDESVEHDLRLKAVVDNGNGAYSQVIFGRELTEKLTGMSLQDAKELAKAEMSREVVANYMKEEVLGKYYRLNCIVRGNVYIVDSYEVVEDEVDVNKLLSKVRGV
jgi:replication factor A1